MDDSWVSVQRSSAVPLDAVIGGHNSDGSLIYVGRAFHDGFNLVAKVIPSDNAAYVCMASVEYKKLQYEVLTGSNYEWVPKTGRAIPQNAVIGGQIMNGEIMCIGRGEWEGSLTVGRIQTKNNCLYIPFKGGEAKLDTYEVLTYSMDQEGRKSPSLSNTWVSASGSYVPKNSVLLDEENCIYVGRAFHKGALLPAMVTPDKACAIVFSAEGKVEKFKFEVLIADKYHWETSKNGNVPPGAVEGGCTTKDEPLYIGRTLGLLGVTAMGLVQQSDGCMYISVDGRKIPVLRYLVLVCRGNKKPFVDSGCNSNE